MDKLLTSSEEAGDLESPGPPRNEGQIREHLNTVLASDEFSSSRRASELLQHLVDRALAGDSGSLKERLLGIDIFHRRSDYNTSTDAIVRVSANDVRRRLANFYMKHSAQSVRISLPLGSYIPDFIVTRAEEAIAEATHPTGDAAVPNETLHHNPEKANGTATQVLVSVSPEGQRPGAVWPGRVAVLSYCLGLVLAGATGWWLQETWYSHATQQDGAYRFYADLLGPVGVKPSERTKIAVTNPHVLLYLGLNSPGPLLGATAMDLPVPPDMAAVLNKTANDNQGLFPYHHFFVDVSNYTGLGEAKAAFGLARVLQATGRSAQLTEERFLNWETARQEQLVILGAPHESKFVQSTLSAANFTIGYDSIHNAHPLPEEQTDYSRVRHGDVLQDYGLIWMTQSPSGTRILLLAGLSSAGTAGVGEFFSDPDRMWPVYQRLRAASNSDKFPESWQVLLRIEARQDVPLSVTPVAIRITKG